MGIFDLSDIGLSNVDMKAVKRIIFLLTNMYPERLGRCFLLDAPTLFSGCWALISPMLKQKTTSKIQFVDRVGLADAFGGDSTVIAHIQGKTAVGSSEKEEIKVSQADVVQDAPASQQMM